MQCMCNIDYSNNPEAWLMIQALVPMNGKGHWHAVYIAVCPNCHSPGIKLRGFVPTAIDGSDNRCDGIFRAVGQASMQEIDQAMHVYPVIHELRRKAIELDDVPTEIAADYKKALKALDDAELYGYAAILARRCLHVTLVDKGYAGNTLNNSIENLITNASSDKLFSRNLIENIDSIRTVGNAVAHDRDERVFVEWIFDVWERVLTEAYVKPFKDVNTKSMLNNALALKGQKPMKDSSNT